MKKGPQVGRHIIQKVAMALVVRGNMKFEWVSTLSEDQISKWLAKSELATEFIRPVRGRFWRQKDRIEAEIRRRQTPWIEGSTWSVCRTSS